MIPTQSFLISALLGDAQSQSPFLLSQAYSPSGSVNLYINKLGQIRVVDGWTKQNAAAFTTDTGASAAMVRGLYMFRRVTSTITRQLLMVLDDQVNEWELHYSTDLGVTKTFIADLGAGSVGFIPDFSTFGDELFICNGVIAPRMWDGTTLTTVGATQLAAPTLADGGPGQLNGSGFRYILVPIKASKVRKAGSVKSASIDVQNRRIDVSWTADADGTVIGYELWRTTGSGLDFFLVGYIDGRTTVAFTDTLPDDVLITRPALSVVAAHGEAPPTGTYFCVPHKGRMWWGRTDTYPRRWYWSDPGDPDSVYTDRNYTDCTDSKSLGDVSTGGTGDYEGMLVLWHEKSVWTVSGTGVIIGNEIDWRKRRTNAKVGTVWHRAVGRVSQGAVYTDQGGSQVKTGKEMLAFLSPLKDIRLFDGQNDTFISYPKTDTLARMNITHAKKSYCYNDDTHGMLVWVFPIDAATEPNYSVAWNYVYGTWHEWDGTNFGHVVAAESSSDYAVVLAGDARTATGALIYKLWSGDTRNGSSITGTLMTKAIYPPAEADGPPDLSHEKRLESLFLLFAKDATPTDITVGILPHDAGDSDTPTISRSSTGTSRKRIPARMTSTDTNPGKFFYGPGFRLKITSTGSSGPWTLQGIEGVYQVLPGQTR